MCLIEIDISLLVTLYIPVYERIIMYYTLHIGIIIRIHLIRMSYNCFTAICFKILHAIIHICLLSRCMQYFCKVHRRGMTDSTRYT